MENTSLSTINKSPKSASYMAISTYRTECAKNFPKSDKVSKVPLKMQIEWMLKGVSDIFVSDAH